MAKSRKLIFWVLFALMGAGSYRVYAQCTDQQPQVMSCQGYKCVGQYSAAPIAGGSLYDDSTFLARCCGQRVNVYNGGGGCTTATLKPAASRVALYLLAQSGIPLRIKGCDGHFQMLVAPHFDPNMVFDQQAIRVDLTPGG